MNKREVFNLASCTVQQKGNLSLSLTAVPNIIFENHNYSFTSSAYSKLNLYQHFFLPIDKNES